MQTTVLPNKKRERAVVFIDGNNFYHALKKLNFFRDFDLNYPRMSQKLATEAREWIETRYYIGEVRKEGDITRRAKQDAFFAHLGKFAKVKIFKGRVERRELKRPRKLVRFVNQLNSFIEALQRDGVVLPASILQDAKQLAKVESTWVEKAVDVMIAVDMLSMAQNDKYDAAYLVSADGDFTPAVEKVRELGKKVFIASPASAWKLSSVANKYIEMDSEFLHDCMGKN